MCRERVEPVSLSTMLTAELAARRTSNCVAPGLACSGDWERGYGSVALDEEAGLSNTLLSSWGSGSASSWNFFLACAIFVLSSSLKLAMSRFASLSKATIASLSACEVCRSPVSRKAEDRMTDAEGSAPIGDVGGELAAVDALKESGGGAREEVENWRECFVRSEDMEGFLAWSGFDGTAAELLRDERLLLEVSTLEKDAVQFSLREEGGWPPPGEVDAP